MAVKPIPDGFHTLTPFLVVQGASTLIDFLQQAFEATEIFRMADADGAVMHAEVRSGDSIIMMGEASGEHKPMPGGMYLYVNDVDAVYKRALQAGGTSQMEPANRFWGDRQGGVKDPAGNLWWIAAHIEDVPPEELSRRAEAFMKQSCSQK